MSIINQDNAPPTDAPTGQFEEGYSWVEIPLSQVTPDENETAYPPHQKFLLLII